MSKEIIGLLEKIDKHIIHHTRGFALTQDLETLKGYVQQALTLAKQQPPASEFTKECAKLYMCHWSGCRWDEPCGKAFREACVRLDRAEAINADLLAALKKYGDHEPGCMLGDACNCGLKAAIDKAE